MIILAKFGIQIGVVLIAAAVSVGILIARRAARQISEFDGDDHQPFTGPRIV